MTLAYYAGLLITGTNSDRTGGTWTNLPAGWRFLETDTNPPVMYYWTGSAWRLITEAEQTETIKNKTVDSSNTISSATSLPTVTVAKGGTGQTTATAGFDALSPMTTAGDIIYGGASGTRTRLAIGTANQLLRVNAGATAPEYASTLSGLTLTSPSVNTPTIKYTDVTKVTGDSPYSIAPGDSTIRADASSGALTVTLPTAVGITGKEYTIKRIDILASSVLVTIATTSSQTISGASAQYLWPGEEMTVRSDGANWEEINRISSTAQHSFMIKGTTANRFYVAGFLDQSTGLTVSTTSPAANTLWALPFAVPHTTKFDTIQFRDTTASTSGNSRVGIYRDNGNCYPGALIFDSGAIVTTGTAGAKNTTITAGLQVFPRGLYWLAYEQDTNTGQIMGLTSSTNWAILGFTALNSSPAYGYSVAHTFGALPDPYTGSATALNAAISASNPIPAVALRAI